MYISSVQVRNFRLLQDSLMTIDENQKELSILLGRNNSGKTSFISIFEKFLSTSKFNFNDYPLALRKKIINFQNDTDINELLIQLIITIQYSKEDSFEYISDFFMDLDPKEFKVNILCECSINRDELLEKLSKISDNDIQEKYIENNLQEYLKIDFYSFLDKEDLEVSNRHKLVKRNKKYVDNLINFRVVHAKRDVASSETESTTGALSKLANIYFDREYGQEEGDYAEINKKIFQMDKELDGLYLTHFQGFLSNAKNFLRLSNLQVKSDLESKRLLSSASKVIYGDDELSLPENLNGLGYLNILYLLMQLELIKAEFTKNSKDINLLFIEEPEAHTHPHLQYVFAKHVKDLLRQLANIQTFLTTHSSHIVTQCDLRDIKYFKCQEENVLIQNFYSELEKKYSDKKGYFKFLKQYLTLYSAELFFAEKIIFIEGISEALLLPYFMKEVDKKIEVVNDGANLSSQNISILEVGANAKVFKYFLEFLDIKALIITDIDTLSIQKNKKDKDDLKASPVSEGVATSNETLKEFTGAPEIKIIDFKEKNDEWKRYDEWFRSLLANDLSFNEKIKISYQVKKERYHARSFEDAFISENFKLIKRYKYEIQGLKHRDDLDKFDITKDCFYDLTDKIFYTNKKSDFASSILYLALVDNVKWVVPSYIEEGLKWIAK